MKTLILLPRAEVDVFETAVWYEAERRGLGIAFEADLGRTLIRIQEAPLQFAAVEIDIRRAMLERFPYGVYFVVAENTLTVLAVLHLHRNKETWRRRR